MSQATRDLSQVLARIARSYVITDGNLREVLQEITHTAADTLQVGRVNIWIFDEAKTSIQCIEAYDAKAQRHDCGEVLAAEDFPTYFSALEKLRTIASVHAADNEFTRELNELYLQPHHITTMLDAPIYLSGEVIGVVCHEHTESSREWTVEEKSFAGAIADFISISLEADRRSRAEKRELELQAKLLESSRLESLGLLAGGIAHDFNNLVGVILVHTDIALLQTKDQDKIRKHVVEIQNAAEHAAQMCQQLLSYSNQKQADFETVNLSFIVEEILRVLKVIISDQATLHCQTAPDLPLIEADPMQLRQIVMNLVTNASEALEGKPGTIEVKTGFGHFSPEELRGHVSNQPLPEGDYVYVEVSDSGSGMDKATSSRMFEPFFTTKLSGRGLGMAGVLNHVLSHQGNIIVKSKPSEGTVIRILLPVVQRSSDAVSA
jgi:two-component system, cell cycle sensor histidine kinase and response regulator CckA